MSGTLTVNGSAVIASADSGYSFSSQYLPQIAGLENGGYNVGETQFPGVFLCLLNIVFVQHQRNTLGFSAYLWLWDIYPQYP